MNDLLTILNGDCRSVLKSLPDSSVHCCVTSPPYWGLRDYGHADQIGQEKTPQEYVATMLHVFSEVRRALRDDGTLWLNLGDSYCSTAPGTMGDPLRQTGIFADIRDETAAARMKMRPRTPPGLKPKDLVGIPWRVAFALQDAGWYLRSDIIWSKPNPMPESVTDRPTRAHEYIFLLSKGPRYYYDAAAIREPASAAMIKQVEEGYNGSALKDYSENGVQDASGTKSRIIEGARKRVEKVRGHIRQHTGEMIDGLTKEEQCALGSNKRSVWTVARRISKRLTLRRSRPI